MRTLIIGAFHIGVAYFHLLWLVPKLLKTKKYVWYLVALLGTIAITIPLKIFVVFYVFNGFFGDYETQKMPIVLNNVISTGVVLVVTTGLWYAEQGIINIRAKEQLIKVKLESEIQMLRQQMNPHFLFNTLNNIYSLSYNQSPQAPEAILKLSDMLRYMLYECHEEMVLLKEEVIYLKNYIELQQLKSERPDAITFAVAGSYEHKKVPSMLLIPFFENAFKHGNTNPAAGGYFQAELKVENNGLHFTCENPLQLTKSKSTEIGGIGLNNVKRRLELLYPDKHQFTAADSKGVFKVDLRIDAI